MFEVPNLPVAVDARGRSACYPRGSFYPLSPDPSTRGPRITQPDFRPCSACRPHSQAHFCLCTLGLISIQPEGTFGRLRYSLGGDRPSQTAHQPLSRHRTTVHGKKQNPRRVVFQRCLRLPRKEGIKGSHLFYASRTPFQRQPTVKLHGVFLSCRG